MLRIAQVSAQWLEKLDQAMFSSAAIGFAQQQQQQHRIADKAVL